MSSHALSSFSNGGIVDLYVDEDEAVNNRRGRPIPEHFRDYDGMTIKSDAVRDGIAIRRSGSRSTVSCTTARSLP